MTECVGVAGWGTARMTCGQIGLLRREVPTWAAPDLGGNFFKYADEQTIVAIRAVAAAVEQQELSVPDLTTWGVIAAPRFLGRAASAHTIARYLRGGNCSPHTIPQHSLHSVSAALSILLGTHGPNVGVGGGPRAFEDGLMAGLTLFSQCEAPGCWLVATEWSTEPHVDAEGNCVDDAVCSAVVLAITPTITAASCGSLRLGPRLALATDGPLPRTDGNPVTMLVTQLSERGLLSAQTSWRVSWGPTIGLELRVRAARARKAA